MGCNALVHVSVGIQHPASTVPVSEGVLVKTMPKIRPTHKEARKSTRGEQKEKEITSDLGEGSWFPRESWPLSELGNMEEE